ncbi:hypothetical protein Q8A57_09545 [Porticoccus litoralis]|jgi:hypothetical protein|uniref:Uncharacterized protein n=1 Tax=Porticoccus litoralis TaxID=434086 RepID=A0AAW8B3R1_9GAMM|nr:hypothetical protein [Porticoccus litoralis]MDP1521211.1 hypothetical protein [Porticoccus litoralis]TNF02948.1 MAG: hypothetical protein EP323_08050 [Gammaproteobacteria bacterium]
MSLSLFEIVILPDGDIALQRTDDDSPLIRISFSDDAEAFLESAKVDVAKVMIDAGIEVFEELGAENMKLESPRIDKDRVLH